MDNKAHYKAILVEKIDQENRINILETQSCVYKYFIYDKIQINKKIFFVLGVSGKLDHYM